MIHCRYGTTLSIVFGLAILSAVCADGFAADKPGVVGLGPDGPALERVVIDADFPGAYQVEIADVNGDGKPDIVALGSGSVAWYENPTWIKQVVSDPMTSPGVISTATRDIDGDGKAEIAIAYEFEMNVPAKGKLLIARQGEKGWTYEKLGDFPSIHRLRWGDFDGDGKADLVVAPIFGATTKPPAFQGQGANLVVLFGDANLRMDGPEDRRFRNRVIDRLPVMHAIAVVRWTDTSRDEILSATNNGLSIHRDMAHVEHPNWASKRLSRGAQGTAPKIGASEVHLGKLADGRKFLAAIEPWHGTDVTVVVEKELQGDPYLENFVEKQVLDTSLIDGHALCVADIDGDGTDEVFAGYRGKGTSVIGYRRVGDAWQRYVIDDTIAAQDLRSGDVDGDGHPDVVAVGGATKNVMLYRTVRP